MSTQSAVLCTRQPLLLKEVLVQLSCCSRQPLSLQEVSRSGHCFVLDIYYRVKKCLSTLSGSCLLLRVGVKQLQQDLYSSDLGPPTL